jgi:diacylglycerol kinase (ATP)
MRAAAILGPGQLSKSVATFQRLTGAEWTSLIEQADAAIIFGGDGTVHRHLAELVELEIPVLVVPCGSGNDFARALGIRRIHDSVAAWKRFATTGAVRTIDLGVISSASPHEAKSGVPVRPPGEARALPFLIDTTPSAASKNEIAPTLAQRYFCCVAGVGIDTEIARRANSLPKWLRAHGGYALSAPREFLRFAPFPMGISHDGSREAGFKTTILAAAANTSSYVGGMKIAPHAQLDDGKLDLCVIESMSALEMFCLFPTVFFGRHLGIRQVKYQQVDKIRIETEFPLEVYADGEYVCHTPAEFSVARRALNVLTPE